LRIYDPSTDHVEPVEWIGNVEGMLLEANSVGERITRLVYKDPEYNWTVGMLEEDKDSFYSGTKISPAVKKELQSLAYKPTVYSASDRISTLRKNPELLAL